MKMARFTLMALTFVAFIVFISPSAQAQATRTWVSGVGDDVNPCIRTAPCKTFAGAISKTAINGEIDAMDPGGFGTVTITKSITIDGTGTFASILASNSPSGITVSIANNVNDPLRTVRIRGLSINGTGPSGAVGTQTGTNGINFINGAALMVEDCVIDGFTTTGILVNHNAAQVAELFVRNTSIRNVSGDAVKLQNLNAGGLVLASLDNVQVANCVNGVNASTGSRAAMVHCTVSTCTGVGVLSGGTSDVEVSVDACSLTYNPSAVRTDLGTIRVGNSVITGNTNGLNRVGGTLKTYGTNRIDGNTNNTVGVITPVAPS